MFIKTLLVILSAVLFVNGEPIRFDNYTLYKIYPENDDHIKLLTNVQQNDLRYDFWLEPIPSAEFVTVMAAPEHQREFENILNINSIRFGVTMPNVQEFIEKQTVKKYTRANIRSMGWDAYYTLDDIYAWLDDLVLSYPSVVTEIIGGETYEGRVIKGIKISHGPGKRAIFLEGGIHAREWISPSTVNFIANELLTSLDPETMAAARDFDWYIFPVTNPDGYVWSHETNRMWRKNRRPFGANIGADLNRNWNSNWLVAGSSTNPASESYAGPGPFSEPETRSLSEYITTIGDQLDMYLSFHSFSQLLLIPFGNSTEAYGNYDETMNIGRRAMGALSVRYGTKYVTGNIAEAIYEATGGSVDWVKDKLNVPVVYCYELRDQGTFGFILPEDQILPNNLETMDSVLELIHQGKRFGLLNGAESVKVMSLFLLVSIVVLTGGFNQVFL